MTNRPLEEAAALTADLLPLAATCNDCLVDDLGAWDRPGLMVVLFDHLRAAHPFLPGMTFTVVKDGGEALSLSEWAIYRAGLSADQRGRLQAWDGFIERGEAVPVLAGVSRGRPEGAPAWAASKKGR